VKSQSGRQDSNLRPSAPKSNLGVLAPLGSALAPAIGLEPHPQLAGVVPAEVAAGLKQRRRTGERAARIHEVHRIGAPAPGIPMEPRRVVGLGVLDPSLLLHSL
jgi:hypothetical protein